MNKIERVTTALLGGIPDKVPYMYNTVMQNVQEGIVGHAIDEPTYTGRNSTGWLGSWADGPAVEPALTCVPEVARLLDLDAISIQVLPPLFVHAVMQNGEACVAGGRIATEDDLNCCRDAMPDPDDPALFRKIETMIRRYKGEFALGARIRLGASPTILSMGMENLAASLADEDGLLSGVIELYTDWSRRLNRNLSELEFDFFWAFDDIAFSHGMMFSPAVFRQYFKEPMKRAASTIRKPWIYHSDGDYSPVLDDILDIGANAIHPLEKGSMDSRWLVEHYGRKLALVGNVDIDHILHDAPLEAVDREVKACMDLFGPGGGYIISDSNSIPSFCNPQNIVEMSRAVQKYRCIYE